MTRFDFMPGINKGKAIYNERQAGQAPGSTLDKRPMSARGRVTGLEKESIEQEILDLPDNAIKPLSLTKEVMESWRRLPETTRQKLQDLYAEKQKLQGEIEALEDEFRGFRRFLNFATRRLERTRKSLSQIEKSMLELGEEAVKIFTNKKTLESSKVAAAQARRDKIIAAPRTDFGTTPAERSQARQAIDTVRQSRSQRDAEKIESDFSDQEDAFFASGETAGQTVDTDIEGNNYPRDTYDYSGYSAEELRVVKDSLASQLHAGELEQVGKHFPNIHSGELEQLRQRIASIDDELAQPEKARQREEIFDEMDEIRVISKGQELFEKTKQLRALVDQFAEDDPHRFYPAHKLHLAESQVDSLPAAEQTVYNNLKQAEYGRINKEIAGSKEAARFFGAYNVFGQLDRNVLRKTTADERKIMAEAMRQQLAERLAVGEKEMVRTEKLLAKEKNPRWHEIMEQDLADFTAQENEVRARAEQNIALVLKS